ncbi:uncharacterized protein ACA1_223270 [Acanthamoeba castellanii str. Neff]|uniref:Uncharacterized protein n=1 Tax=Acanthamoeba castellanii (strain ATCC 30010 / Neff) TaxID=1257118 RepID=L8GS72_ACACF|nr:uncharacterized protein ACA1_223270 [Acanthamoeba castellanii str. Neff]ELR16029.1 hypothetical protein ACA1_223270 [Acanthamoeba castellanii str. Neff]
MLNASEIEKAPFLWQQWMHYAESCSTQGFEKAVNELGKLSEDAMSKVQRSVVLTYCYLERAKCFQESGKPAVDIALN